jgi:hypothetical protein
VGRLAERVGAEGSVVWVDYIDYAGSLLAPGGIAWTDETALVALYRKAQGLLDSDVMVLPLWRLASASIAGTPELRAQMCAKTRATHPLRCLLASEKLRTSCRNVAQALRTIYPGAILALSVPSPRLGVLLARRDALGKESEISDVGAEEVDSAAPYMADFLRVFGDVDIDVLLLHESPETHPSQAGEIEWYRPVLNVAAHYRWDVGLQLAHSGEVPDEGCVDFVVREQPETQPLEPTVVSLGQRTSFLYLRVPPGSAPEATLERLRAIRSTAGN